MKYLFLAVALIFFGCSDHNNKQTQEKQPQTTQKQTKNENKTKIIQLQDLNLTFKNDKLIYPQKRVVLLFKNNSKYSKYQEEVLKKLNVKYYTTDNEYLKNEFNITILPSIVILDKNKSIKFENFTPYEFLKEEF
jgi:hypothetical protein